MEAGLDFDKKAGTGLYVVGWIFSLLGGLIGIAVGAHIGLGKVKLADGSKVFKYDKPSRTHGIVIMVVGIISLIIWRFAVAEM